MGSTATLPNDDLMARIQRVVGGGGASGQPSAPPPAGNGGDDLMSRIQRVTSAAPAAPKPGAVSRLWGNFREGAGLPSAADFGTVQSNKQAAMHPLDTLEATGRGLWDTYKGDVGTAESHLRAPGWRNKVEGLEQEVEAAIPQYGHQLIAAQEQTNRGDTAGGIARATGVDAAFLGPKALHEAPGAILDVGDRAVRAARTSAPELAEQAKGPLEASTAARQGALNESLKTARQNVGPLYENLHAADEANNPTGAIDLGHVIEDNPEIAPKEPKAERLSPKEIQDAGFAAKQAERMASQGISEEDIRQNLKQFGYTPGSVNRALESLTQPGEEGGYTIAKARALRQKLGKLATKAEAAGNYQDAARFNKGYGDVTDAMRERAEDLDPSGRLADDFDRADKAYGQAREDQRVLSPLLDALEGDRTPSPEKFQEAWDNLTSAQRSAINRLAEDAGLDKESLEAQGKTSGKVLKGASTAAGRPMSKRMAAYYGARLGIGAGLAVPGFLYGRKHGNAAWELGYPAAMLLLAGAEPAVEGAVTRGRAIGAMEDLPETQPRPSYAAARPSVTAKELQRPSVGNAIDVQGREVPTPRITAKSRMLPEQAGADRAHSLPAHNGPSGAPLEVPHTAPQGQRALPQGTLPRPVRGLLPERTVNVLDPGRFPVMPGERAALPQGGQTPKSGVRTIAGKIVEGGHGRAAAPRELVDARGAGIDAEINRLEDRLLQAPNKGVAKQIQNRIRELNAEKRNLLGR